MLDVPILFHDIRPAVVRVYRCKNVSMANSQFSPQNGDLHPIRSNICTIRAQTVTAFQLHAPFVNLAAFQALAPGQLLRWDHPSQILLDNTAFVDPVRNAVFCFFSYRLLLLNESSGKNQVQALAIRFRLSSQPPAVQASRFALRTTSDARSAKDDDALRCLLWN